MAPSNDVEITKAARAIPNAGRDFEHLLDHAVVIEADETDARSGAQRIEPDHSPRTPLAPSTTLPKPGLIVATSPAVDAQREVEQFLYRQAELLDGKHWQ